MGGQATAAQAQSTDGQSAGTENQRAADPAGDPGLSFDNVDLPWAQSLEERQAEQLQRRHAFQLMNGEIDPETARQELAALRNGQPMEGYVPTHMDIQIERYARKHGASLFEAFAQTEGVERLASLGFQYVEVPGGAGIRIQPPGTPPEQAKVIDLKDVRDLRLLPTKTELFKLSIATETQGNGSHLIREVTGVRDDREHWHSHERSIRCSPPVSGGDLIASLEALEHPVRFRLEDGTLHFSSLNGHTGRFRIPGSVQGIKLTRTDADTFSIVLENMDGRGSQAEIAVDRAGVATVTRWPGR